MGIEAEATKEAQKEAISAAWSTIAEGGDVNSLPWEQQEAIGLPGIEQLRRYQTGMVQTDPELREQLWSKYADGTLSSENPAEWLGRLDEGDYNSFLSKWAGDNRAEREASAVKPLTVTDVRTRASTAMEGVGIFNSGKTKEQYGKFMNDMMVWMEQNPDLAQKSDAVRAHVNSQLINVSIDAGVFSREQDFRAFEIDYQGDVLDPEDNITLTEIMDSQIKIEGEVVPGEVKAKAVSQAAAALGRDPTAEEVMDALTAYYIRMRQ
jgi:hypothetical protein